MKILSITLKNLNSLRGTWNINLEDKAYTSGGIFAVTGPTGAGKTTIFDAVCLALYRRTPRLPHVTSGENEIMSKHTNSCGAKVKFESCGKIYVCEWTQKRTGKTFQATHTISLYGKPLTDSQKQKDTSARVKEITGMDFDRFVQAVLLEQGGFDRFLNAKKNERAEVLELITGTGIYSEITSRVYRRSKDKRTELDGKRKELESEKSRFEGMTQESLQAEISRMNDEILRAEAGHKSTGEILTWQREIMKLNNDMAGVRRDIAIHAQESANFEAGRVILESAERAVSLGGEYEALRAKREAVKRAEGDISALSAKISSQESECSKISAGLPRMNDELSRLRGEISGSAEAVVKEIEAAVKDYERQKNNLAEAEREISRLGHVCRTAKDNLERIEASGKKLLAEKNRLDERRRTLHEQFMSMDAKTREAVLDEERAKLQPDVPCPLCGSTSHPGIAHTSSGSENPDDMFAAKAKLNEDCKKAEEAVNVAEKKLQDERDRWQEAHDEKISAFNEYSRLVEEAAKCKTKLSEAKSALTDSIRPAGITWDDDTRKMMTQAREWSAKIDGLEKRIQSSQQDLSQIQAVILSGRESLDAKRRELETFSAELGGLESSFSEKLRQKNFDGEESFLRARSHSGEIESLRRKRDELSAKTAMLDGALMSIQKQLDEQSARNLTSESPEKIEELYRLEDSSLKKLHQEIGILTQRLKNVTDSAAKVKALEAEYDDLKAKCDDWDMLNALIGSAEGDKFRVYAQKVTLSLVVNNANEYLRKMNGRYTLIQTPGSDELELSVKDSEQAGTVRTTENLSGGEKFIISLALALGLSQISGSRAQVDSLFIDEGFGSLDEEALSSALDALGEIRREGRMIGIISHISGISERITAKINVIRKSEGTSIITGPGCSGSM